MARILALQKRPPKLVGQGIRYLDKRDVLLQSTVETVTHQPMKENFNQAKVSEGLVKTFGAKSCVYRAYMEIPGKRETIKLRLFAGDHQPL